MNKAAWFPIKGTVFLKNCKYSFLILNLLAIGQFSLSIKKEKSLLVASRWILVDSEREMTRCSIASLWDGFHGYFCTIAHTGEGQVAFPCSCVIIGKAIKSTSNHSAQKQWGARCSFGKSLVRREVLPFDRANFYSPRARYSIRKSPSSRGANHGSGWWCTLNSQLCKIKLDFLNEKLFDSHIFQDRNFSSPFCWNVHPHFIRWISSHCFHTWLGSTSKNKLTQPGSDSEILGLIWL